MSDNVYAGGNAASQPGILAGSQYQQLDLDIQALTRAVNRIAQILTPPAPQIVSGSRASGAALVSLLGALAAAGIIVDHSTP